MCYYPMMSQPQRCFKHSIVGCKDKQTKHQNRIYTQHTVMCTRMSYYRRGLDW
jgi:hypothetical protein